MKRILTILTVIAVMFTFSFGAAFAGTFTDATVGKIVTDTVNAVDTTPYLVKDAQAIEGLKSQLIDDTDEMTAYDATVVAKIDTFKAAVAAYQTYETQKSELAKYKTTALVNADNAIAELSAKLTTELDKTKNDTNTVRKSTLTTDINTYKEYVKAQINAVEIISNKVVYDKAEVDLTAAKVEIDNIVKSITDITTSEDPGTVKAFYALRDKLNYRTTLITEAERYAKVLALEVKTAGTTVRKYSDAAIANVLADVKAKINVLDESVDTIAEVQSYMKTNCVTADAEAVTNLTTYKTNAILSITTGEYAIGNWSGASKTAVKAIQDSYTTYINNAANQALVDAYVSQAKAAIAVYKTDAQIAADAKAKDDLEKTNKEQADKLAKLEADLAVIQTVSAQTDDLKCTSKKTKSGIKVTVKNFDFDKEGYTVKYTYYRAAKKSANYKIMLTKDEQTYTNTIGTKGTKYFYKVKISVYDANGVLVTSTKLSDCKAAYRVK